MNDVVPQFPWSEGDHLYASALNAAIANGPYMAASIVNVLALGAKGDGTTDDTAAIQAALNSYAGQSAVFVPDTGHPYIVRTLTVPSGTDLLVHGTMMSLANSGRMLKIWNVSNVTVRGHGTLDGNGANQVPGGVLDAFQATNLQVSGITMQNARNWNLNVVNSSHVRVTNCQMLGGQNANEFAQNSDDCWLTGCTIDGPSSDFGFSFYGGVTNSGAIGNVIRNSGAGIYVFSDTGQPALSSNITISNNFVYNNYAGILVGSLAAGSHSNIIISNNRCYGNNIGGSALYGEIQIGNVNWAVITGNLVSSGTGGAGACPRGIRVETATDVTVTGNAVYNIGNSTTAGTGLYFNSVTGLFVTANSVYDSRAPQYTTASIGGTAGISNTFIANSGLFPNTITLNVDTVVANARAAGWAVGTGTGSTQGATLIIDPAPGTNGMILYRSANNNRWEVGSNSLAETGGNTGCDYIILGFNDDGSSAEALHINRATKQLKIVTPPPFANDAAASAGGVPVGGFYRIGTAMQVRVV